MRNPTAAEEKFLTEEAVKEKKDVRKSIIITIIANSKLWHFTRY